MDQKAKDWIARFSDAAGGAKVTRNQLPELNAIGISEADLIELGVEVVELSEMLAETDLLLVCPSAARRLMADNVFTVCALCGGAIQHRPNVPDQVQKVCIPCAEKRAAADRAGF